MTKEQLVKMLKGIGVVDAIGDPISIQDTDFRILYQNRSHRNIVGDRVGEYCYRVVHGRDRVCERCQLEMSFKDGESHTIERSRSTDNGITYAEIIGSPFRDSRGEIVAGIEVVRDITLRKAAEEALLRTQEELEKRVEERTAELQEMNTTLKVLLKQREEDKRELEKNILSNIKHLILPYVVKLKGGKTMPEDLVYLNIIESNLMELISPFSSKLSSGYLGFTPRELQIADLIKDGKQDKDIMAILNISPTTVKSHRQNIRKKLGIYSKRTNLRSNLLSLSE